MLAICVCLWTSCSDGGSEDPANPTPKPEEVVTPEITISSDILTNGLTFDTTQSEKSVSFSTNVDWTLSIASTTGGSTWCKASATSGSKGSANVKFTVDEHTDYDDRSVSVTIKAGTASKTFTITQKCADALLITTDKYEVAQDGATIEVEVKANTDYQVAISETAKSWISEVQSKSRALTTRKHSFTIAASEDTEKREGEITFKSGDKVETVKVYQAGGPIVLLTKNEYTVSDQGETISVDLKSNVEFSVKMPEVDWITEENASRAMSSHTLKYVISPNESYDSRSAEIVFYDKNSNVTDTLKVIQAQKDAIVISKKNYEVKAEGETIEVKLSANVEYEVTMPETDWVSQVSSRALTEHTLYFKVTKNEAENGRSAEITFTNNNSGLEEKIVINQQGTLPKADVTINVTEPGTLSSYIASDRLRTLTSIKIVGQLNDDDLSTISKMSSLEILDLSEAEIIGGIWEYPRTIPESVQYFYIPHNLEEISGSFEKVWESSTSWYIKMYSFFGTTIRYNVDHGSKLKYIDFNNIKRIGPSTFAGTDLNKISIPEGIDSIHNYTFTNCFKLKEVVLPNSLRFIGDYAFDSCPINSIKIPSNLKKIEKKAFTEYVDIRNVYLTDLNAWCNVELTSFDSNPMYWSSVANLYINNQLTKSLIIDNNIERINDYTFSGCSSIEKLTIGDKVEYIGKYSFSKCKNMTEVKIGNNVKTISECAFYNCPKLKKIILGTNINQIEKEAFKETGIEEVYCYATTPPKLASESFVFYKEAILYVPKGTYSAYYLSNWGSIFTNIIEMEE